MALTFRPRSHTKTYSIKSQVNSDIIKEMINETIKQKLFNVFNIDRMVYFRLIQYFFVCGLCPTSGEKTIVSIYARIKNKKENKYQEIKIKEIEASGINISEFIEYLNVNGAKEILSKEDILDFI